MAGAFEFEAFNSSPSFFTVSPSLRHLLDEHLSKIDAYKATLSLRNAVSFRASPLVLSLSRIPSGGLDSSVFSCEVQTTVTWTSGYDKNEAISFVKWGLEGEIQTKSPAFSRNSICGTRTESIIACLMGHIIGARAIHSSHHRIPEKNHYSVSLYLATWRRGNAMAQMSIATISLEHWTQPTSSAET